MILGNNPDSENSTVNFRGTNNILYCEENVKIKNSLINFESDNSIVYLGSSACDYFINLTLNRNTVFHMGRHNYIDHTMNITLSEHQHCFIGNYGAFSSGINIMNSDAHLIYDCSSYERVNPSQSIYIGDHVWIGKNSFILKGTMIDSGSIIGAMSVVPNKRISYNESWAGNPVKRVKQNVFWNNICVHNWYNEKTEWGRNYKNICPEDAVDDWIYNYNSEEVIEWTEIESMLSSDIDVVEKCKYLAETGDRYKKNRFVHLL